jgi:NAD-dependent dihydropyrimidine dehydrogenase PreA subunit
MPYVVTEACVDCKDATCVDACPVDCLYEGPRMLYIHPVECVTCGACESACPVEAIWHVADLAPQSAHWVAVNAEFCLALGSPGGAAAAGPQREDHPLVRAMPALQRA